jgi:molybdenum cofactor synthesis domain-containing protein
MNNDIEVVCVGTELLTGHTLNTNAYGMAKKIASIGGMVRRVTVVGDDVHEISACIRESLRRKPRWIIITGGLGPTYDDKTLQGLARAVRRRLVINNKAVEMLRRKYLRTPHPTLTASRYKMATMPAGSEPLENPVGHAPSVMMKIGSCMLFALPGVPKEMEAIMSKHVIPIIRGRLGRFVRMDIAFETKGVTESLLSPYLDLLVAKNPHVYVKSHPKGYSRGISTLHINLATVARDSEIAHERLEQVAEQMKSSIKKAGGSVKRI